MSIARYSLIRRQPFTVKRFEQGSYVNGRWVEGGESEFEVKAIWYPLKGSEKQMLPDAFRSKYTIKIQATTELYSIREADSTNADQIFIDGYWFEIQERDKYSMRVVDHYEYLAVRTEQSAGGGL